jgi:hypothetical protein
MANPNITPNINYNAILVERHYIPVDIYTRMYSAQQSQNNRPIYSYESGTNFITQPPVTTAPRRPLDRNSAIPQATGQPTTNNPATSRYNDLLSFFNIQSRNGAPTNTEPLQSRVITRSYESAADIDPSFVNLLMTAFYTPEATINTAANVPTMASRLTTALIDAHSRIITYSANVDLDTTSCSICAQEWQHGEELRKLTGCRHYFHKSCVDTWLQDHNTCPLCRTNIIQTPVTNGMSGINDVD